MYSLSDLFDKVDGYHSLTRGGITLPLGFTKNIKIIGSCWIWIGTVDRYGYGKFSQWDKQTKKKKSVLPHRYIYKLFKNNNIGRKPLDHLCRNILCCNPDHLEVVTHLENIRRKRCPHCEKLLYGGKSP